MKMSSYLLMNHLPPFLPISLNLSSNSISKPKSSFSFPISAKPKSSFPFSPSFKVSSLLPASPPTSNFRLQSDHSISKTFHSLNDLKPFIISQHKPILLGWLCSLVSVYSLSNIVTSAGKFSSFMRNYEAIRLSNEGLILGIFVMARLVACYWQQAFLWEAALRVGYGIRVRVFKKVLERDLGFFEGREGVSSGDIAYRITAEASDIADTVYALLNTIVPSILQLSAMAVQMLAISLVMSLISALVIPFMAFAIACLGEKLRKISSKAHLTIADLSAYLNEMFPAILFVKANNAEFCENARFERLVHADLFAHMRKKKMKALIPQITQIIYFGSLFLFFVSSLAISTSSIDICGMMSFLASLIFLIEPIQGVGKAYNELKQGEPAIERLFDLTRFKPVVMEKPSAVDLKHVTGDLQFCNISFKYEENMPLVLNGLNLHIKAGETVALVGPSGGGKTTLVKLLLRLYDPSSGSIYMDNHDIQNIKLKSLRRHVGLVSQDITLFSGTVAENIGYKDLVKNIDMERVKHAARTANADEFIKNLPEGYKTYIGLRGSMLSGGQKQRIAIARALYQDSSILILDEATSALDSRSELLVRQAVQRLMENHTVLVIAHRLETVLMAKRIFHLEGGKLDELTHSTLLSGRSTGLVI